MPRYVFSWDGKRVDGWLSEKNPETAVAALRQLHGRSDKLDVRIGREWCLFTPEGSAEQLEELAGDIERVMRNWVARHGVTGGLSIVQLTDRREV